jgi:hypothetical protein
MEDIRLIEINGELFTDTKGAAKFAGVAHSTIRKWIRKGTLASYKVHWSHMIAIDELKKSMAIPRPSGGAGHEKFKAKVDPQNS